MRGGFRFLFFLKSVFLKHPIMHLRMQIFWEEGIVIGPTHVIYSNQAEYGVVDLVVQSVTLHLNLCS